MNTDLDNVPAVSASVAIVSDDGTVFEAEGQLKVRWAVKPELDYFFAGLYDTRFPYIRRRKLCVYIEIDEPAGSITVPADLLGGS